MLLSFALATGAAELKFEFSDVPAGKLLSGFRSVVAGEGLPGDWRIILDEVPPLLPTLTPQARSVTKKAVLAQLAQDGTDEHFPMLIYEVETFSDFTFTTRIKTVGGEKEQMAGVVFRFQDERNFYVVRASSLGNNIRFYKVVNGERGPLIGPTVEMPTNEWRELTIECKGNQIQCRLDGKEIIPLLMDTSFGSGKIGFWTKSDAVSYFADARVTYVPREVPAQAIVRQTMEDFPRLLGVQIYLADRARTNTQLIASTDLQEIGRPGGGDERIVIREATVHYRRARGSTTILSPLRDRNGDVIGVTKLVLTSFAGQTEDNALARALPIFKSIQARVGDVKDLRE